MAKLSKSIVVIASGVVMAGLLAFFLAHQEGSADKSLPATAAEEDPGWVRGPQNAPITLVEFGDYQCPSCAIYHPIVLQVLQKYPTQVKLEFHHFPLVQIHPSAMMASVAAEAAGEQGRFWEMHDMLFEQQQRWSPADNPESEFLSYASRLSLDADRFMREMRSHEVEQRVLKDVIRARNLKIESVPAFYLNGARVRPGATFEDFQKLINQQLDRSK